MIRPFSIAWLAVLVLSTIGGRSAAEPRGSEKADTPEAAAEQFLAALMKQDRKAYEAAVVKGDLAKSVFDFAAAAESFKRKMIKSYGEVGWKDFQDPDGARVQLAYNDMKAEDLKFETDRDTAKAKTPDDDDAALCFVLKDGRWLVDLDASLESQTKDGGLTPKSLGEAFGSMAKTMREFESKIGDGMTVEELDKAMGAEFLSALLGAGAKPKITVTPK